MIGRVLLAGTISLGFLATAPARAAFSCDGMPPEQQMADDGIRHTERIRGADLASGREMATALRAVGVPTEMHTVVGRGSGEPGTTLTGGALASPWQLATGTDYPTAGHGWEEATTTS